MHPYPQAPLWRKGSFFEPVGHLYILPFPLSREDNRYWLYPYWYEVVREAKHVFVERVVAVRNLLQRAGLASDATFYLYDEKLGDWPWECYEAVFGHKLPALLLSEAGLPGVADPGYQVVQKAHAFDYIVVPLAGPSSITLALAASGLPGNRFTFHGYLPIDKRARRQALQAVYRAARHTTQIFIETPGRQEALLHTLLREAPKHLLLCVAHHLTAPSGFVKTRPVSQWEPIPLPKAPTLFLLGPQTEGALSGRR